MGVTDMRVAWFVVMSALWMVAGCGDKDAKSAKVSAQESTPKEQEHYQCPMKCKVEGEDAPYTQAHPGQCPVCGMDLEKQE